MRPSSIVWFERLFLLSLALAMLNAVLSYGMLVAEVESEPALAGMGGPLVLTVVAASLLIPLILWYFIARRASVIAKWLLVALIAIGLLFGSYGFESGITLPDLLGVVVTILQLLATALLFRADAREWLAEPRP